MALVNPPLPIGIVYLIHFEVPLGDPTRRHAFARHYTGWCFNLPVRLVLHAAGHGARIMAAVAERGIAWQLACTWDGTRELERRLKRHGAARRCPVCRLAALELEPAVPRARLPLVELGECAARWTDPWPLAIPASAALPAAAVGEAMAEGMAA